MNHLNCILLLILPCLLLVAVAPGELRADSLIKYSTPDVRLYTDAGKDEAGKLLDEIAFFAEFIDGYFKEFDITPRKKNPIRCKIFARDEDFSEYRRKRDVGAYAGAYFSASDNCIVAPLSGGRPVLLHECGHQIFQRYFNNMPVWFDEGLATLFEGVAFDEHRHLITFCSNASRLKHMRILLARNQLIDWERFFGYDRRHVWDDEIRRGVLDTGTFYTQAWAVIFYYARTEDAARKKLFAKFLQGMHTGRERTELLQKDLMARRGDFDAFFREDHEGFLRRYHLAANLDRNGKYNEALGVLLDLLEFDPENRAVMRLAADTTWNGKRYEISRTFWEMLAEKDPRNTEYPWRICRCLVGQGLATNDTALLEEAVKKGKAAVKRTHSQSPHSLAALAMAYHASGDVRKALSSMKNANRFKCEDSELYKSLEKSYSKELSSR